MRQGQFASKKKKMLLAAIILIFMGAIYVAIHAGLNIHTRNEYASENNGFEQNALGDYCKNCDGMVLSYYDAGLTSFKTNLSAGNDDIALLVWISLINSDKEYGVLVQEHDKEESHQIAVDKNLKAKNESDQKILDKNKDEIAKLKDIALREWPEAF